MPISMMSVSRAGPRFSGSGIVIAFFARITRPIHDRTAKTGGKSLKKSRLGLGEDGTLA
jgi:hypothetical protein